MHRTSIVISAALCVFANQPIVAGQDSAPKKSQTKFIWPDLAPGESDRNTGEALPMRPADIPPITRLTNIRRPTVDVYPPTADPNGVAVLIMPGGGFGRVVPDLEGSEAAAWLGKLGITCFVLNYRTSEVTPEEEPKWKRPLQDGHIGTWKDRAIDWLQRRLD